MVTVHCVTKWCPHCSLVILKQIRFTNILFVANILCSNLFGRDLFLKPIQVESTFWRRTMVGKFFFLCLSILRTRSRFTSIVFRDIKRNTTVFHNYIKSGGNTSAHCMSRQCFVFTGCIVFLAKPPCDQSTVKWDWGPAQWSHTGRDSGRTHISGSSRAMQELEWNDDRGDRGEAPCHVSLHF